MARLTQQQFKQRIGWWLTFSQNPRGWNPLTKLTRDAALGIVARLLVKQYISARREREARKVQQCYDSVNA